MLLEGGRIGRSSGECPIRLHPPIPFREQVRESERTIMEGRYRVGAPSMSPPVGHSICFMRFQAIGRCPLPPPPPHAEPADGHSSRSSARGARSIRRRIASEREGRSGWRRRHSSIASSPALGRWQHLAAARQRMAARDPKRSLGQPEDFGC